MPKLFSISLILVLALTIFTPRLLELDRFRAPDEDRWMGRTTSFVANLAYGQLGSLLESPTPGLTTQWLGAFTIHANDWQIVKFPLALIQGLLIMAIGYVFSRLWGKWPAFLLATLLALNPLLIGHTRIFGTDSLLSLFLLLSLGLLLLWSKTHETRYLVFAGATAAAAYLSKLPGILIIPFSLGLILFTRSSRWRSVFLWLSAFIVTSILILPPLALTPYTTLQNILETFRSEGYTELHTGKWYYYLNTLFFHTTPLHFLALLLLPFAWPRTTQRPLFSRFHFLALAAFALLFTLAMSFGDKKGDRYLLPTFLFLDALTAIVFSWLILRTTHKQALQYALILLLVGQSFLVYQLHPYYLAYVNPVTKPLFGQRRLGWGEGLDLAAEYLNQKPEASSLKVASYYPNEFSHYFSGEVVPAHEWDHTSVDYTVIYRAMFDRGETAWETDVIQQLKNQVPEKIIRLNNLDYAWIYKN
jgi:4-amino-4-deoxy-L-arabinose transferase-like glycosyltransferase